MKLFTIFKAMKNRGKFYKKSWLIKTSGQLVVRWYGFGMSQPLRQTEILTPETTGIDTWPDVQILNALQAGQERALAAVRQALPAIAKAADAIAAGLKEGGKLVYAGA